jgi:hypothetical protein
MNPEFRLTLASPPDRERLVVEVFSGDEQIAELNRESGDIEIELYPRRRGTPWIFPCAEFLEVLSRAKDRLGGHA